MNYVTDEKIGSKCNQCDSTENLSLCQFSTDNIYCKLYFTLCKKCDNKTYSINTNFIGKKYLTLIK